jgi:anthranilate phosphoribosyltransferase
MKEILNHLFEHKTLSKSEAKAALTSLAKGNVNHAQMAAFCTVFRMRSLTVDELEGFRDAMLDLCLHVDLGDYDAIDVCGTGGDSKNTFNISTLTTFVAAGAGVRVAKHGNYAVSSSVGSSNVLEYLGIKFTNDVQLLRNCMEASGICIMHAPLFHPAMKNMAPVRKELGVKTFFNMLGPMVNPSFPHKQMVGVYSLELARLYAYLYQNTGKRFVILHSLDGYDEISLTSDFKIITDLTEKLLSPADINKKLLLPEDIYGGGSIEESAKIFMDILKGKGTEAQNQVVIANSGMAIYCANPSMSIMDAQEKAKESLLNGSALKSLEILRKVLG